MFSVECWAPAYCRGLLHSTFNIQHSTFPVFPLSSEPIAMNDNVDLLFISAHADDTELSCGGTIAKMVKDGLRVGMIDLTRGEMGTRGTPEERAREARKSARILGAAFREHLDLGDGGLRTGRDEELQIIELVRRHRPRLVFSP